MSLEAIADRDHNTCGICLLPVDMTLPRTHRMGATVDHIVPLVCGGTEKPKNLRLAHWICNVRRGLGGFKRTGGS